MDYPVLIFLVLVCHLNAAFIQDQVSTTTIVAQSSDLCPGTCQCNKETFTVFCTAYYKGFTFEEIPTNYTVESLTLYGGLTDIPEEIQYLPGLVNIDLSRNSLQIIKYFKLKNPEILRKLILRSNDIDVVNAYAFVELSELLMLDLSENKISHLSSNVFSKLLHLEVLKLGFNQIRGITLGLFDNLKNLKVLDLSNNQINHLIDGAFSNLPALESLYLNDNNIWKLSEETVGEIRKVKLISLLGNPWDCSCELKPLKDLVSNYSQKLKIPSLIQCKTPQEYSGVAIATLDQANLPCTQPNVSHITESQNILVRSQISLHCEVEGNPLPLIYWITPWGSIFAHSSYHTLLIKQNVTAISDKFYESTIFTEGMPRIYTGKNGDLIFEQFMGSFHGMYTCFAINIAGETNATVQIDIHSALPLVKISSLLISGLCAGGFLAVGLIVGAIKVCALRICKCSCLHTKPEEENNASEKEEDSSDDRDYTYLLSESELPSVPVNSPVGQTPRASPLKCETPNTDSSERGKSSNINDTLVEVKVRLEKKIEKVRSRVHSIRESGSQYLTSIKDTGSQAAIRVKAGVVLGVEQVKSGVQSMKEFCGTGDMGTQTISAISISETDLPEVSKVVNETSYV